MPKNNTMPQNRKHTKHSMLWTLGRIERMPNKRTFTISFAEKADWMHKLSLKFTHFLIEHQCFLNDSTPVADWWIVHQCCNEVVELNWVLAGDVLSHHNRVVILGVWGKIELP